VGVAKLDRRWLDHPVVLDAMVRTCRDHGLTVIAVGVETMEQLATVHEHGIRMCQGFVIARPQPVDDLVKLLTHGRNR
jgi:EAL domain-containing protein (putative c-di-GMP-specific phosphodiesterase class I)